MPELSRFGNRGNGGGEGDGEVAKEDEPGESLSSRLGRGAGNLGT